jgi:hypothetical protein
MAFKALNNDDFRQALKYYFGESDQLPSGATAVTIGRHDDVATMSAISYWDTSEVTDMSDAFKNRRTFDQDISRWKVLNVVDFSGMFHGAQSFNQPLGLWNTSGATNMEYMFRGAVKFNQYIGGWNVSNVTNFSHMFFIASSFNQDISNWNVGNGKQFQFMFAKATDFSYGLRRWNVKEDANLISMFVFASALQSLHSDVTEFADTPMLGFFNYVEPAKKVLYGYDMTFQAATVDQTALAIARRLHRRAYNSKNGNSGVQYIMTKLHTQAARATLSQDGIQPASTGHDRNLVLSRLRRLRG